MPRADVAVYGGTAAGVVAAVAAARRGARVVLLEPGRHLGGMVSGGLGWTDTGNAAVVGGLARRFHERVAAVYGVPLWHHAGPEPHVAEAIFEELAAESGIELRRGQRLSAVRRGAAAIEGLDTADGLSVDAAVFVDASYEGDLLAAAGLPYRVGRESRALHGERFAGRQEWTPGKHNVPDWTLEALDEQGRLLPLIHDRPLVAAGDGDGGVMGYGYRLCLTRDPARRLPFPRPAGYDPARFELLRRHLAAHGDRLRAGDLLGLVPNLPNQKTDANSIGPISLSLLDGSSWRYPEADVAERAAIARDHLLYAQGFCHALATESWVPVHVRRELSQWGLAADEFEDTAHWPHQLYVREARRLVGEHVLTEHDLWPRPAAQHDAVLLGSYHIDVREVQRVWRWVYEHPRPVPSVFNEGYLSVPVDPYPVPYRCLVPRREDCANLLVPVCISASHVAFASYRMEVQYMMAGHAVGVAATFALESGRPVQEVDVPRLQAALAAEGQVLP